MHLADLVKPKVWLREALLAARRGPVTGDPTLGAVLDLMFLFRFRISNPTPFRAMKYTLESLREFKIRYDEDKRTS